MIERVVEVLNRAGIHARPAALIVKVANQFSSQLYMEKDRMKINGKINYGHHYSWCCI